MTILFMILKIIGIILLVILGILLLLILTVLFVPVRYRGQGKFQEDLDPEVMFNATYLLSLISVRITYRNQNPSGVLRILFLKKRLFGETQNKEEDRHTESSKKKTENRNKSTREKKNPAGFFMAIPAMIGELQKEENKEAFHLCIQQLKYLCRHFGPHKIKGNLRVYCRVRPCLQKSDTFITYPELSTALTTKASYLQTMEIKAPNTTTSAYTFDRIFPESSSQVEVFNEIQQFIQSALDGESVCVFAYGATGSGKTFTMQGTNGNEGVLPRCASFIFNEKERLSKHNEILLIYFAAIEIYNENVFDLLNKKTKTRTPLVIYSAGSEVNIPYLIWEEIKEKEDIIKYTNLASESRRSDSTSFNATSSRSHAIFQIKIINEMTKKTSMINIIDLAGSERSQISSFATLNKEEIENMKKIQTEANFINKSLSALGRIINLIGDNKKSSKAISIPYRESKLTVVLQNYLKPNAKTVMIVNVAGETKNYNYTKESLNFAANAMVNC